MTSNIYVCKICEEIKLAIGIFDYEEYKEHLRKLHKVENVDEIIEQTIAYDGTTPENKEIHEKSRGLKKK